VDAARAELRSVFERHGDGGAIVTKDAGYAPIEVALGIGLLLLPIAVAVLSFGPWLETRVVAEAAAAEASRAAVLAIDTGVGDAVIVEIAANHQISPDEVEVGWCGAVPAASPAGACTFERGSLVSVEVRLWTPAITTPWGEVGGVWVSGTHSEPVDLYRSLG
jgi:hypothetical protein